jgi:hypothetical protein
MNTYNNDATNDMTSDTEEFELIKADLLEVLRYELGGWDISTGTLDRKLLREAFMAAVAELRDDDFGEKQDAGEEV